MVPKARLEKLRCEGRDKLNEPIGPIANPSAGVPGIPSLVISTGVISGLALLLASAAQSNSAVYRFTDERGVVHFSDAPADSRYQLVQPRPRSPVRARGRRARAPSNHSYDRLIVREAQANHLDPALVKAVIAAESNFSPLAISHAGARGLMQLMPETARTLGVEDPFQVEDNVGGGTRYLRQMLDRYGDLSRALAAYNAGPGAVDRHHGIPPYPETEAYVERVLAYYRGYWGDFLR